MTVTTTIDRVTYQGNGTAGDFAYPFKIFAASNLVVELVDDTTGTVTPQSLGNDYGVTGVGRDDGGRVSFFIAPATGVTVRIRRVLPIVQEADFTNQGVFYPERHENALDYLTACLQSLSVSADNALQLSADGSVWDGESLRLTNVADGQSPQDAATLGQLEQVVQNIAAGQAAFAPLYWQYTSAGAFVYPLPGASLTRSDAYTVTWDGIVQSPNSYVVGTSSNPFVMTFDSIPPTGATILIRSIGVAETLSSANIDASGVVSGQFDPARLGLGVASDAVFLVGGPSSPTWTNFLNGPLQTDGDITTAGQFIGSADTTLITSGIFPPNRLGTGVYGVNTVLHGDGVYRIPAVATTTGFGLSDAVNAPAVFTAIELTGDISESAEANPINVAKVKTYIKNDAGGTATLEGYVTELFPAAFGLVSGPAVMMQPGNGSDSADWWPATTNDRVLMRRSDSLNFFKLPVAAIDATGTAGSSTFLRGDGAWTSVTANLGTTVSTTVPSPPTMPSSGLFYRGDSAWSNSIDTTFAVKGGGGAVWIYTNLTEEYISAANLSFNAIRPMHTESPWRYAGSGGGFIAGSEASDRVQVNGRVQATRTRTLGSPMVRIQSTATSGAITLDHNAYGHFITTPTGNVTYTFSDGGTDPSTDSYASTFTLEIVNPGANTFTWPAATTWVGGIAPTLASASRNLLSFTKRQGVSGWLGALIGSGSGGFTTEDAQDAVGAMLANSATVTLTYSDATPSLTAAVVAGSIGANQLASNAVEEAKIATGAVTNTKIAAGTITTDRLAATGTRDATTVLSGANTWVPLLSGGGQAQIQFKDEGTNVGGLGTITAVNFTGSAVTASAAGSTLNVAVTAGGVINYADDGFVVANSSTHPTLSFGTGLSLTDNGGGTIRVDAAGGGGGGSGGQAAIQFRDEGTAVGGSGTITGFNVVGAGASLSVAGTTATLTIPGGSGGGGGSSGVIYNVRDYGATGNGASDDTASIQAAVTAASSAGGGIVVMPSGTYLVAGGITVPTKCALVGAGMGATTIKLKNSAGSADIVRATGSYVQFADFTIDGNASNNVGVERAGLSFADAVNNCRTTNVTVSQNRGFGFAFNRCTDMLFDNCRALSTKKKQGFWMGSLGSRSSRITFVNCHAILNDWDGIHIHGDQIQIIGGYWNQNGQDVTDIGTFGACGIYVDPAFPCVDTLVTGAHAEDNKETGIQLCGEGMTVANCIARRNWAAGINLNAQRGIVTGCYAEGNGLVKSLGPAFWTDPSNPYRFVYSGICSLSSVEIIFTGNRCHDLKGTKTQKWGISAETAATGTNTNYLRLVGNMLHGNLTADTGIETATNATVV